MPAPTTHRTCISAEEAQQAQLARAAAHREPIGAKHTPGPWLADWPDVDDIYTYVWGGNSDIHPLVRLSHNGNKHAAADARLIAAAPDLLEAVQGLLDALPSATSHPAIAAARAAIAKAGGAA